MYSASIVIYILTYIVSIKIYILIYIVGDIAHYDTDGKFYIVDRLKELIKYKGLQVNTNI